VETAGTDRLEEALAAAAARFARGASSGRRAPGGAAVRLLAARFDLPFADLERLAGVEAPSDVPPALLARLRERLERERRRLGRLARAGSSRYDLARHLAVRDALRWANGAPPAAPATLDRLPGAVLNGRFARTVARSGNAGAPRTPGRGRVGPAALERELHHEARQFG
jgi:hypothetical protein